jgi:hypothetical protein
MQIWLWMLNAINGDRKQYIDKYLLRKFVNFNFSEKAPDAKIVFKKLGNQNMDMVKDVVAALITKGAIKPDIEQLGEIAGLTFKEIREVTSEAQPADQPGNDPSTNQPDPNEGAGDPVATLRSYPLGEAFATADEIKGRVGPQIVNAFQAGTFGPGLQVNLGYKRRMEKALEADGVTNARQFTVDLYNRMDRWVEDVVNLGPTEITDPDAFMGMFSKVLQTEIERAS